MLYACILAACLGQDSRCSPPLLPPGPSPAASPDQWTPFEAAETPPPPHVQEQSLHLHAPAAAAAAAVEEGEEGWRDTGMLLPVMCAA